MSWVLASDKRENTQIPESLPVTIGGIILPSRGLAMIKLL